VVEAWEKYLGQRGISSPNAEKATFPEKYGVGERDEFYKRISYDGWGGSSGHGAMCVLRVVLALYWSSFCY
jgi:ADP-ribosylarginine hydrolase